MRRVAIVGGGITGLATALHLRDRAAAVAGGLHVVVLEAGDELGGNIRTDRVDGFTIEQGPNGFLDNAPATLDLVRRIGLEDELQRADEAAARRFLYRDGRLHLLPSGPVGFLRSRVLSLRGRLRVFGEPFARARPDGIDESVFEFAARRIGPEAAAVLVDAMVSGVFAGNVHELSLRSSFPKLARMEEEHGGLVRAMVAGMRRKRQLGRAGGSAAGGPAGPGGTLTSFRGGLDRLVDGLGEAVADTRVRSPVTGLRRNGGEDRGLGAIEARLLPSDIKPWSVLLASGESVDADAVVLAIPSPRAAPLVEPLDPALGSAVAGIETTRLAVVALGFRAAQVPDLHGFGFLVPRGAGPRILGCLWDSSIFPGRAPGGHGLIRVMIGGAHDPDAVFASDDELLERVGRDLATTMGLRADPILHRIYRWPLGIAQYRVGHQDRLDRIHARLRESPGLWVAGSSFYGISMNACFEKAPAQADEIIAFLTGSP